MPYFRGLLLNFLLGLGCLVAAQEEARPSGEIERLVADLAHEEFEERERATAMLVEKGLPAVDAVVGAALSKDPEISKRSRQILAHYADTFEPQLVKKTIVSLESVAAGGNARARKIVTEILSEGRARSARYLKARGLPISETARQINRVRIGDDWKGTDHDLRHLLRYPELEVLNVSHSKSGDAMMKKLVPNLPKLEKLYLGYSKVTAEGLSVLPKAGGLEYLSLQGLAVGDGAAKHVGRVKSLKHLGFDYTKMADGALQHISGLENLETLWLNGLEIKGPGLVHLAELGNLHKLILAKSPFGDAGMPHLAKVTQIRQLGLDDSALTDAGVKHLPKLVNLERLWLNRTKITDAAVPELAKMKNLEKLYLGGTEMSQSGLKKLKDALPNCEVDMD